MKKAFTLVELIVVITILAVLATVAFISFQWYTVSSRDTVRLSDMKSISQALNLQVTQSKNLPSWQDMVNVTASGSSIFSQWILSKNDLANIWVFNGWFDPVTGSWYVYARNTWRNKYQIGWYFEQSQQANIQLSQNSYANNLDTYFYTKWDKIWVLLEKDTNNPISENIDIINTYNEYISYIANDSLIEWTWSVLRGIMPNANCNRLYDANISKSWIYEIYSFSGGLREVYCDFSYPEYIISDELLQTGDFLKWNDINTEDESTEINTIIEMNSPIDSGYVVHQTWEGEAEYEIHLLNPTQCTPWKTVTMRLWVSKNNEWWRMFNHKMFEETTNNIVYMYDNYNISPEIIDTTIIDGRTWNLEQLTWVMQDNINWYNWHIWYDTHVDKSDFYFTWVRLWCE